MFSRFKKKIVDKPTIEKKEEKKASAPRILTAEGWKRMMLKKNK